MADIIQFRARAQSADDDDGIDLLTAVDAAIRDLREISQSWGDEASRIQAEDCRRMLEKAFAAAI